MRIEPRTSHSRLMAWASPLLALLFTIITAAGLFAVLGKPPLASLHAFFIEPISSIYGVSELFVKVTPLLLCATGLALCFRAKVWNIGAEGQFVFGALIAGAVSLQLADQQGIWVLPTVIASGVLAGMAWAGIAALLLTRFRAHEILTTIMLNYIAIQLLLWSVHGPLKNPSGYNFPESALFSPQTLLPTLWAPYRVTIAIVIAVFMLAVVWTILNHTFLGFQARVMGENREAARFVGFHGNRLTWLVLLFSGGMAGMAGVSEVNGPVAQLTDSIAVGYGYTAIIIVFMGRMHPFGILLASLLLGLTYLGGENAQMVLGLPKSITGIFQGLLLFFLLACDFLISYRLVLVPPRNRNTPSVTEQVPHS
ncbi:ABC transporter permease [Halomonadaceae bacterium KBTZ08]